MLTQSFECSTDSMKDFEKVLDLAIDVVFKRLGSKEFYLNINRDQKLDYGTVWDNIPFVAEVDNKYLLLAKGHMFHGVVFKDIIAECKTKGEAAGKAMVYRQPPGPPKEFNIGSIHWIRPSNESNIKYYQGKESLLVAVKELFESINKKEVIETIGDGYNDWFNSYDGDVKLGFQLKQGYCFGSEIINLNIVHIYYGK